MTTYEPASPATVGFMDIGTNSIRLMVVRFNTNNTYTVLRQLKETVRSARTDSTTTGSCPSRSTAP